MSSTALTLNQVLREAGFIARWEAEAEAKKAGEIAGNLLRNGFSPEQTAQFSGLDIAEVRKLANEQ